MLEKIKSRLFKWFKVLLFSAVVLVTLGALVLVVESWRAEKDWKQMQQEIAERGEPLTWQDMAGAEIPDEENFAMTPLLRPLSEYTIDFANTSGPVIWKDPNAVKRASLRLPSSPRSDDEDGSDGRVDFEGWRKAFEDDDGFVLPGTPKTAAEDVLFALKKYDGELEELTESSRRLRFEYMRNKEAIFSALPLPFLRPFKGWALVFKLRATALLETANSDHAFEDIQTILRLAEFLEDEPLLITQLVEIAVRAIAIKTFWQGWADHKWSAEHLAWFQSYFATNDSRHIVPNMYVGERAFSGVLIRDFSDSRIGSEAEQSSSIVRRLISKRNQIAIARLYNVLIDESQQSLDSAVPLFQPNKDYARLAGIPPAIPNAALSSRFPEANPDGGLFSNFANPYTAMAVGLVPAVTSVLAKMDRIQVTSDLVEAVCALERYWLEHDEYPDDLASLVPTYLPEIPMDLMDGQPLRYTKRDDGWFDLYSVGHNQKDDGGVYERDREYMLDLPWPLPILQTFPQTQLRIF